MTDPRIDLLLHQIDLGFDRRSWHGPNLGGSLRGVTPEMAAWRPGPSRHNIWEETVHCAYWKYRVCRLLAPEHFPSFSIKGSDWFPRPEEATAEAWQKDLELLRSWHQNLRRSVQQFESARLDEAIGSGEFSYVELISGIVAHDIYHAGQIRLIRRMQAEA